MELRIYGKPEVQPAESRWARRWWQWREAFDAWAAPVVEADLERERSLVPVALLMGLALAAQYAQLSLPAVRAFLLERDAFYRTAWVTFTLCKQWALFFLMLVALRIKDDRLAGIGFPRLDARRLTLALALVGFFLGVALLRTPGAVLPGSTLAWLTPVTPSERALDVLLALTAAVVEETFFRGFTILWTYRWSGHLPLAVGFPAFVFAAGHAAFGWLNVGFSLLAAVVFSGLLLWRRDLYWAMVLHFVVDVWGLLA